MARRDEQIDGIEPNLQRRAGVLKDRASGRIKVRAAGSTGPGPAIGHAMECAIDTACRADVPFTEPNVEDVRQAGFIIGEALEKIADAKVGGC